MQIALNAQRVISIKEKIMTNTEYILEFIDSNTVYKHLIDIGYEPDALTAAYIVWQSKSHTLAQKEEAFEWIIENMPDMKIPRHEYHAERESLHEFLDEYIGKTSIYVQSFVFDMPEVAYDFSAYYGAPDNAWVDDDNLYSSYKNVMEAIRSSIPDERYIKEGLDKMPLMFRIKRRTLDFELGSDYLYLTPELEDYKLSMDTIIPDDDYEVLHLFENLCLPIPHPFKKGDIVRECAGKYALPCYYNDTLVVNDYMSEKEIKEKYNTLGCHDYTLYGICSDGEGGTYEDSVNHYLHCELVTDCTEEELFTVSNAIKGEKNKMTNKDNRVASESKPIPLENALNSDEYVNSDLRIPLTIGYDKANKLLVENLTRMPHLLVAGCSGSGKSAFLRNVITSITSRFTPDEVKLVLFDLKRTEFDLYAKDYPHSSGVITDIDSAVKMLRYLLDLSRERSKLMTDAGIISALRFEGANAIDEYNAKTGSSLPRIVVIIDEFAELMTESEEVEELIFELTRCAHGAGIHLVLASQRAASDEVITDRVLANMPTRACLGMADKYDGFRIVGEAGAEELTCGEMIYSSIRATQKVKVPYISTERSLELAKI